MRPIKASEVKVEPISDEERRKQIARKRVAERKARAEALRRNGALNRGTAGLEARLEARLADIDRKINTNFKAKSAVRRKLGDR